MLAGKMKLTHFLGLAGLGVVAIIGGIGWWWSNQPEPPPHSIAAGPATAAPAPAPAPSSDAGWDYQAEAMSWAGQDLGTDKRKDVSPGKAYKLNVYQDPGNDTVNRLKIDLDRDGKWDEKWTFEGRGGISRKVAPRDDEAYTVEQTWDGSAWSGGPPAEEEFPPAEPATTEDGSATELAPAEAAAMSWQGKALASTKLKDVSKGESWKINVYQDEGRTTANRLKIDLDRDDKWDQKWTFHDDGGISRKLAPNDDEDYTLEQVWGAQGWVSAP